MPVALAASAGVVFQVETITRSPLSSSFSRSVAVPSLYTRYAASGVMVTTMVSVSSSSASFKVGMLTVTSVEPFAEIVTVPEGAVKSLPAVAVPLTV